MRLRVSLIAATLTFVMWLTPAWAEQFLFRTAANPDGKLGALSRPPNAQVETETADDFPLTTTTVISRAVITGLIVPTGSSPVNISRVEVEVYHIFSRDSDATRTINVPTRVNSPSDVEIPTATRDSLDRTLSFSSTLLDGSFTVTNSVVNNIFPKPNQTTHGEGPKTGEEVAITINFTTPLILQAGHFFFRPEVEVSGGNFLWLSAPKPILSDGTPFPAAVADLQAWIRNADLKPDWLRIGTDIIGIIPPATTAPTFNMTFSLAGDTVPDAGTPERPNCHGKTISALAHQFGGIAAAASTLGASNVPALQQAVDLYCALVTFD